MAHTLASRGCAQTLTYRGSRDASEMTATAARAVGVPAIVLRSNATDENQIEAAVCQTAESLGQLDILINMAGIYVKTPSPFGANWSGTLWPDPS
jgi:3-oxoacyl-[acyl-carrier protein] reductase